MVLFVHKGEMLDKFSIYYTFMCVDFSQKCGCEMTGCERIELIKVNAISILNCHWNNEISDVLLNAVYYWVLATLILK